ncbi:serine hydrolase domain-containing protein [Paenibacillus physcomitrellae]|uniref:Serine hydrolase n=2 Tax=Paenibacillus physcomitrellae TaxID=1619311 RepID=A0ABQ1GQF6_9BACL|nr:serine hydrolase domain-containing protein [Paenibacillus physcomitrellae]GGA48399.1 serine hydrolase [Paenibacillus physcomitrellae]
MKKHDPGERYEEWEALGTAWGPDYRERFRGIWQPLRDAVQEGLIPGGVAGIRYKEGCLYYAVGLAEAGEKERHTGIHTLYDCASLTKVTVTLPLILMLWEQGKLDLDDRASIYIPELNSPESSRITVRQLLSHTAGLPPTWNFHCSSWNLEQILHFLGNKVEFSGPETVYSDLGFILLGVIAERLLGTSINEAARMYLFSPLEMKESCFCPSPDLRFRIASTEWNEKLGGFWTGIVHDENARALGGISGHAGLFATCPDLLKYAQLWLEPEQTQFEGKPILSRFVINEAQKRQGNGLDPANRGLGWVLKGNRYDVSGSRLSDLSFGHTGFTGTSLYMDPQRGMAAVLMTNRVHFGRQQDLTGLRTTFHDAAAEAVDHLTKE